jgi:hypothetical protein
VGRLRRCPQCKSLIRAEMFPVMDRPVVAPLLTCHKCDAPDETLTLRALGMPDRLMDS